MQFRAIEKPSPPRCARPQVGLEEVRRWLDGPEATRGAKGTKPTRIVEAVPGQPLVLDLL